MAPQNKQTNITPIKTLGLPHRKRKRLAWTNNYYFQLSSTHTTL